MSKNVVGGRAKVSKVTEKGPLRKPVVYEPSMKTVGCGYHNLRVSRFQREKLLVTQSYTKKWNVLLLKYRGLIGWFIQYRRFLKLFLSATQNLRIQKCRLVPFWKLDIKVYLRELFLK